MSEQEREARRSEEPDVEGHRTRLAHDSEPPKEEAKGRKAGDDDEPDVEGHRTRV